MNQHADHYTITPCALMLQPGRYFILLGIAIFGLSIFFTNPAMAIRFTAQQSLPADLPELRNWNKTVVRIEITKGSAIGTNKTQPFLEFKVVDVLRAGMFHPRKSQKITAQWIEDRAGGDRWDEARRLNQLDQWEKKAIESPPAGTRLIAFVTIESANSRVFLAKDSLFADTPENRAIVLQHAASRPFMDRLEAAIFWLTFILPAVGFFMLFFAPRIAVVCGILTFPAYLFYDSRMPVDSIRLDMIATYPAMAVAALIIVAGLALWVRKVAVNEQLEKESMKQKDTSD